MNKKITVMPLAAIVVIAIAATVVFAQSNTTTAPVIGSPLLGSGLAISTTDSTIFRAMGIEIAANNQGTYNGALVFASEKLHLTNIAVNGNTVTGDIQRNSTTVGSVSLTPTSEANHWTGTVTLDSKSYNAYVLSTPFNFGNGTGEHFGFLKSRGRGMGMMKWSG
jgi:hypothetical protein